MFDPAIEWFTGHWEQQSELVGHAGFFFGIVTIMVGMFFVKRRGTPASARRKK